LAETGGADLNAADLIGEAIRLIRADPGKMMALSAIALAPSWLASLWSGSFLVSAVILAVSLPLVALANGALVVLVTALRNGTTMPLGELLSGPRDGFVRLTIAYVLLSLVLGVGLVLLVVPGLVALAFLWAAWPLVVLEEDSGVRAMKRSVAMVDGSKLKITIVIFALLAVYLGLVLAQMLLTAILGPAIGIALGAVVAIAMNALGLTVVTLSYHRLRGTGMPAAQPA